MSVQDIVPFLCCRNVPSGDGTFVLSEYQSHAVVPPDLRRSLVADVFAVERKVKRVCSNDRDRGSLR